MNKIEETRIKLLNLQIKKERIRNEVKDFHGSLDYYLTRYPENRNRIRIETILIRKKNELVKLEAEEKELEEKITNQIFGWDD